MTSDEVLKLVINEASSRLTLYGWASRRDAGDENVSEGDLRFAAAQHRMWHDRLQAAGEEYYRETLKAAS